MTTLLSMIQNIAVKAVNSTNPTTFTFGTVTSADPLKIRIDQSTIELEGDSLILTANVVEKTLTIQKHNHGEDEQLTDIVQAVASMTTGQVSFTTGPNVGAGVTLKHKHSIETEVVDAVCTEFGEELPKDKDDDRIVVTINRALKKDDRVIMLRVCAGQEYIILSRVFGGEE